MFAASLSNFCLKQYSHSFRYKSWGQFIYNQGLMYFFMESGFISNLGL